MKKVMMQTKDKEIQPRIYLNTAAAGLLSPASVSAAAAFGQTMLSDPGGAFMQWMQEGLPRLREKTAALLGARPQQVAFVPNFSFGLLPVVQSLQPRITKILLYRDDYPSLNLPFELGGFEVYYVDSPDGFSIPLAAMEAVIEREKIEAVAISHVQFLTGFKTDLPALGAYCREKGIALIVDATQSMGAVDLQTDALPVDVLISSSYKWLNGGYGSAVLCMKEDFMARFPPRFAGFGSMKISPEGWRYAPSISSYEPGHLNVPGLLQLEQAIDQRMLDGMPAVEKHNTGLVRHLAALLAGTSFKIRGGAETGERASILCFEAGKEVYDHLRQRGFALTWRKGLIRVSPHFHNTVEEMETLAGALEGSE